MNSQEINYLWVHVFENVEKMANRKARTNGGLMRKNMVFHQIFYNIESGIGRKNYGNFFYKTEKRYDNNLEV